MPEIINLKNEFSKALEKAMVSLEAGGVIVFPTDTVYGIAVKYDNQHAIQRIYQIKDRDQTKALPVLIGNTNQFKQISTDITSTTEKLIQKFWPGALTIVLTKNENVKTPLSMDNTIGVRLPNDHFVISLSEKVGPLATTSANKSGLPNTTNVEQVLDQIGEYVDLIIDGGESPGGIPSSVVDCRNDNLILLREGKIKLHELEEVLKLEE